MVAGVALCVLASTASHAIPALQLGPGTGNWTYDNGTQTWVTSGSSFNLNAYANDTSANGGNGFYAWETEPEQHRWAYLVLSAIPKVNGDAFDLDVSIGGTALSLVSSGYGAPPLADPNSLSPHGVFDTWFEVYEFKFTGQSTTISDTQPVSSGGSGGTGQGFVRSIDVAVSNSTVVGVHADLFSVSNGPRWDPSDTSQQVYRFAPFSHDAENTKVSEPAPLAVLGFGLIALGWLRRRSKVA